MPIFEYVCENCDRQFEQLFLRPDDLLPECPECGQRRVRKLISAGSASPMVSPQDWVDSNLLPAFLPTSEAWWAKG